MKTSIFDLIRARTVGLLATTIIFSLTSSPSAAGEGNTDGHGGSGVVCRDRLGAITSAAVLDLYEAERLVYNGRRAKIVRSEESLDIQLEKVYQKLEQVGAYEALGLKSLIQGARNAIQEIPGDAGLEPVDDIATALRPKGNCKLEQIANFLSTEQILVDNEIWRKLSKTDRAALIVHEAVYLLERGLDKTTNSRRARRITGAIFDQNTRFENIHNGVPNDALECMGDGTQLYVYRVGDDWRLQFLAIGGEKVYSKKTFDVSAKNFNFSRQPELSTDPGNAGAATKTTGFTRAQFEGDDVVTLESVHEPLSPQVSLRKVYLSGRSGWEPGRVLQRADLNCSLQTALPKGPVSIKP